MVSPAPVGHVSNMSETMVFAKPSSSKNAAIAVANIKNGNNANKPDKAMWLAIAQPSSLLNLSHASLRIEAHNFTNSNIVHVWQMALMMASEIEE